MRINTNIQAMNTHRQMGVTSSKLSKSMEKLSSGYRINRAGDDVAGLAISEKMRAQVNGLNQASRNAQDGISMIQTFEGALNETHSILQRMRELTVQSANDTNAVEDRSSIHSEIVQLKSEVDRIANNTEFNTKNIMNYGAIAKADGFDGVSQNVVNTLNEKIPQWINDSMEAINTQFGIAYPDSPIKRDMTIVYEQGKTYGAAMATTDGSSLELRVNLDEFIDSSGNLKSEDVLDGLIAHEIMHAFEYTEMATMLGGGGLSTEETWVAEGLSMLVQGGNGFITADGSIGTAVGAVGKFTDTFDNSTSDYATAYVAMKTLHEITTDGIGAFIDELENGKSLDDAMLATTQANLSGAGDMTGLTVADYDTFDEFMSAFNDGVFNDYLNGTTSSTDFTVGTGAITDATDAGSSSNLTLALTIPNGTGTAQVYTNFNLDFTSEANTSTVSDTPEKTILQIGANQGQTIEFNSFDATSNGLGIDPVNVTTQEKSNTSIKLLDEALNKVSTIRSTLGANQNRLEHTISNLNNTSENLQAAESRIRDVDLAKEMMEFTKNNILKQASQSMLAQANSAPEGVLQLLQ